jgi:hypothetical protein
VPAHYTGPKPSVLDIFSTYSLKIPQIYSNMLEYTRIYSNILDISLSGGRGGLTVEAGGPGRRAGAQTTLCKLNTIKFDQIFLVSTKCVEFMTS